MFGKIVYISDNIAHISIPEGTPVATNLMNMHVVFEDANKRILGEVQDVSADIIKVVFLGEITDHGFIAGVIRKPTLEAKLRIINKDELAMLVGTPGPGRFNIGVSPLYDDYPILADVNDLFSNHMAIFGNSGSGKSCGVARLLQNIFIDKSLLPYKSNFFIFDAYGEYHNSFQDINKINPNYNFKYYSTNKTDMLGEKLRIPLWLLDSEDLCILLNVTEHSQIPIVERMLKLVTIFSLNNEMSIKYKNHLIAKAIIAILFTNQTSSAKRNDIFSIIESCSTKEFSLESPVQGLGYVRKFRDCFIIDTSGQFTESILVTEYVTSFIDETLDKYEPTDVNYFTLEDLEKALNFTLISEGLLRNDKAYADAITLKVRLHSLLISEYSEYFKMNEFVTKEKYIASLVTKNNRKAQIINFNLEDVDDWFAKFVTKTFAKMLFNFAKNLNNRATIPFHIFLEEAHRYVQNDNDNYLLGYNIFERIVKEGRKYGVILDLISQRPVELSETVISQVSNFMIFKLTHPRDIDYVKKMLPNISADIVEKQKSLQPGTCVAFGPAFKIPMIIKMKMPDPAPQSSNCDIINTWTRKQQ